MEIDHYLIAQAQKKAGANVHGLASFLTIYISLYKLGDEVRFTEVEKVLRAYVVTGKLAPRGKDGLRRVA